MTVRTPRSRYTIVAITLHWLIALAILTQLTSGFWMTDAIKVKATQAEAFAAYQLHKSIGISILVLSLLRLGWRIANPPPPLPAEVPTIDRWAAKITHWAFYALMIGMPLVGWAVVSASPIGLPTILFGVVELPHIGPIAELADKKAAEEAFAAAHSTGALIVVALLALHIAGVLKHFIVDDDGGSVMRRMIPGA